MQLQVQERKARATAQELSKQELAQARTVCVAACKREPAPNAAWQAVDCIAAAPFAGQSAASCALRVWKRELAPGAA